MPDATGFVTWAEAYESNHRVIMFLKSLPQGARLFIDGKPELDIPDAHLAAEILQVTVETVSRA